jgi:superfamily II DNA or RNA helicase
MQLVATGEYRRLYDIKTVVAPGLEVGKQLTTMPGFAHRVKNILEDEGFNVTFSDIRTPPPKADLDRAVVGLYDFQYEAVITALLSGGGQVSAPTGFGKTRLAAAIINAFPFEALKLRGTPLTILACPDKEITRKNYVDMCEILTDRKVGIIMSGKNKPSEDVNVVTMDSMHHIDPDDIGILIVDEVHTAPTSGRSDKLLNARFALRWGVSATPTGRFDGSDLINEGMFGPVVYQYSYQQGVKDGQLVPIKVCWVHAPQPKIGIDRYNKFKTRRGKYNHGVHNNPAFNAFVVKLLAATKETHQALCMVQFLDQMESLLAYADAAKLKVMHVHATTSTAPLEKAGYKHVMPISKDRRETTYEQMRAGDIRKAISTFIYKQGVNFPNLEVVINATGGGGELLAKQFPGRASRKVAGKDVAYIVDFWHEWDTSMDENGKTRRGPIFADDKSREKYYTELGFDQTWYNNIEDLPFIKE